MIVLSHIHKQFSRDNVDSILYQDLSLTVDSGQRVAIMGASGSGKSTLLHLIAGLDTPQSGTITIDDQVMNSLTTDLRTQLRGKYIGFIFQQFHLIPNLTVRENIDLVIELNSLPRRYTTEQILDIVDLADKIDSYPSTLSGGEQQRVAIARAFVADVPLILADEPTGNLDEKNADAIMSLMKKLHEQTKITIVMITHDKHIASYAGSRYTLTHGQLVLL